MIVSISVHFGQFSGLVGSLSHFDSQLVDCVYCSRFGCGPFKPISTNRVAILCLKELNGHCLSCSSGLGNVTNFLILLDGSVF
jgi:hypothetical protein